jgi:FMN reductase
VSAPATLDRPRVVAVSGNPRPGSRTAAFALRAARAVAAELGDGAEPALVDLADPGADHDAARAAVAAATVAIVASPTFKATYTGLLKGFLDGFDRGALDRVLAVPLMVQRSGAHTLAADVHLRPLLIELGAICPTPALVVAEDELPGDEAIGRWLARGGWALRALAAAAGEASTRPPAHAPAAAKPPTSAP